MKLEKVERIVIHTAAAANKLGIPVDQSAATIRDYHVRTKGWSDIGYHYVIRMNGRIEAGRPEGLVGAHVEGFNSHSLGICLAGHGDKRDFTAAQKESLAAFVVQLLEKYSLTEAFKANPMRVLGHRECYQLPGVTNTGKSCPGTKVDMTAIRLSILALLKDNGRA